MSITYEALLKGLIKQMVLDQCSDEEIRRIIIKIHGGAIGTYDLTNDQRLNLQRRVLAARDDLIHYLQTSGGIDVNWEAFV